jgi:galactose mutarotase-like enzyme
VRTEFGHLPSGEVVERLVIGEAPGPVVDLLTLGATVHRLEVTGGDGERRNVVLGHDTVADRLASSDYLGATIGRYANRIAHGRFELAGAEVCVQTHDRGNSLHGGPDGFDRRVWEVVDHSSHAATLRLESPDGDMGFPGTLSAQVRFEVTDGGVRVTHEAKTDATTVVNLTNHSYFNLDGDGAGTVDGHRLSVLADSYTPVDATGIPSGDHVPVSGTPFDLREAVALGAVVRHDHEQIRSVRGIDHNYVVRGEGLRTAAVLESPRTRTVLELRTDQPGLQVYTGNNLDGAGRGRDGRLYRQGDGIALEPQLFPDSPNHPEWPSAQLEPGEVYRSTIEWSFGRLAARP